MALRFLPVMASPDWPPGVPRRVDRSLRSATRSLCRERPASTSTGTTTPSTGEVLDATHRAGMGRDRRRQGPPPCRGHRPRGDPAAVAPSRQHRTRHADSREVLSMLLGELTAVPWPPPHRVPPGTVLSTWRTAIGEAPLQQLHRELLAAVVTEH